MHSGKKERQELRTSADLRAISRVSCADKIQGSTYTCTSRGGGGTHVRWDSCKVGLGRRLSYIFSISRLNIVTQPGLSALPETIKMPTIGVDKEAFFVALGQR